jgi:hypothetical protein
MTNFITLTDHEDHGEGKSPLIIDADRVIALAEFKRSQIYAGPKTASGIGTKVTISVDGVGTKPFYVQETIYVVAGRIGTSARRDGDT